MYRDPHFPDCRAGKIKAFIYLIFVSTGCCDSTERPSGRRWFKKKKKVLCRLTRVLWCLMIQELCKCTISCCCSPVSLVPSLKWSRWSLDCGDRKTLKLGRPGRCRGQICRNGTRASVDGFVFWNTLIECVLLRASLTAVVERSTSFRSSVMEMLSSSAESTSFIGSASNTESRAWRWMGPVKHIPCWRW